MSKYLSRFLKYIVTTLVILNNLTDLGCFSYNSLNGLNAIRVSDRKIVDIGESINSLKGGSMIIFGTYAADFNTIEYAQRIRYYLPQLKEKGITNFKMIVNGSPEAAKDLFSFIELPGFIYFTFLSQFKQTLFYKDVFTIR